MQLHIVMTLIVTVQGSIHYRNMRYDLVRISAIIAGKTDGLQIEKITEWFCWRLMVKKTIGRQEGGDR